MKPSSSIKICNVPFKSDYKNVIDFSSLTSQKTYFNSITNANNVFENYTYISRDKPLKIMKHIDSIINNNYLFYDNNVGKTYFCFIKDMRYINENCTEVYFETDVYQTWLFDFDVEDSFVEREHVDSDNLFEHTYPEGLETGEFITNDLVIDYPISPDNDDPDYGVIIMSSVDINTGEPRGVRGGEYNKIYSGFSYYYVKNPIDAAFYVEKLEELGKVDAILGMFMCPRKFVELYNESDPSYSLVKDSKLPFTNLWQPTLFFSSIDGYTPKNKKLYSSPYSFMNISNNAGTDVTYLYERLSIFQNEGGNYKTTIEVQSAVTSGMSIRAIPTGYNNTNSSSKANSYGINLGKFPVCAWTGDMFTNWLTQNSVNMLVQVGSSVGQVAVGAALISTGAGAAAGAGLIASGSLSVANTIGTMQEKSTQPYQTQGNVNSGDVTFANDNLTFSIYQMTITQEYAKIIDNYFTQYGYKVAKLKNVNTKSRRYWNYIKTIDVNIVGNLPQDDLNILCNIYNNGTTIWHTTTSLYNYSLNNVII